VPWTRKLYEPITLKDGRKLVTLDDARAFMLKLSKPHQLRPTWQYAGELVLKAAEDNRAGVKEGWAQLRRALVGEGLL
jgi:hypothetical protein